MSLVKVFSFINLVGKSMLEISVIVFCKKWDIKVFEINYIGDNRVHQILFPLFEIFIYETQRII